MAEYIEREAAYKTIMGEPPYAHYPQWYADKILSIPAVDAVPVRHGRWRFCGSDRWNDVYECGNCGKMAMNNSDFCPNCGAKMDSEVWHDQRRSN